MKYVDHNPELFRNPVKRVSFERKITTVNMEHGKIKLYKYLNKKNMLTSLIYING